MCISSMLEKNFKLVSKVTVTSSPSWQQCIAFFLLWNCRQSGAYLIVSPCVFNFVSVVSDDVELFYSFEYIFYKVPS